MNYDCFLLVITVKHVLTLYLQINNFYIFIHYPYDVFIFNPVKLNNMVLHPVIVLKKKYQRDCGKFVKIPPATANKFCIHRLM